jgi:ComF family protein
VLAVALAPACAACGDILESPLAGPVCGSCWSAVRPVSQPVHGDRLDRVAADYRGPLRDIIHAFKYERRRSLAGPLARLMTDAAGELLHDAACVVPVPLHPWKRVTRGFNQAADLAAGLGPPLVHALWRPRWARAQVGLPAAQRRRNVHGAFAASPWLQQRQRAAFITGRVVVLVDDVRTTGATLSACAAVLASLGAGEVRRLTLAQAPIRDAARPAGSERPFA